MRTRATAVLLWLAATVAATLLVSAGVGAIRDTTRADELVARPPATTADTAPTDTTAPTGPTLTPSSSAVPAGPTGPAPTVPTPTAPAATAPPATAPPATVPPTPTTPATTAPPTTAAPAPEPVTLTIPSEGGSATIRFSPDAVTVVAATPAAGYAAKVSPQGSTAVRVEFENDDRRSRIEASWNGGPVTDVRED